MEDKVIFREIEAMRMGVDYVGQIQIRDFRIQVRPLSSHEYIQLMHDVASEVARMPDGARTPLTEHFIMAKRTLMKATSSDVGKSDSTINDIMLNRMTMNEVIALYKEYAAFEEKCNPLLENLSKQEMDELLKQLKKNPSEATKLSFSQAVTVLRCFLTQEG